MCQEPATAKYNKSLHIVLNYSVSKAKYYEPKIKMEYSLVSMILRFFSASAPLGFIPSHYRYDDSILLFSQKPQQQITSTLFFRKGTLFSEAENDMIRRITDTFNSINQRGHMQYALGSSTLPLVLYGKRKPPLYFHGQLRVAFKSYL